MRIFNENKTIELTEQDCDLTKGYLKEDYVTNGEVQELIYVYTPFTQKQMYIKEADELRYWFENEYKELFEKYSRKIALGINLRDGADPRVKLNELYSQAETKANRIHELKEYIKVL